MELIVMIGIIFFFGAVILSTVMQRGGAPQAPVIFIRADPIEGLSSSDAGLSLVILLLVIGVAIWVL